jgi:hypothetical protein
MPARKSVAFQEHFADVTDPRHREGSYPLIDIMCIVMCTVVVRCGRTALIESVASMPGQRGAAGHLGILGAWPVEMPGD